MDSHTKLAVVISFKDESLGGGVDFVTGPYQSKGDAQADMQARRIPFRRSTGFQKVFELEPSE